jgi:acetyl/propionyl-CoA carboxylase alpha subunit
MIKAIVNGGRQILIDGQTVGGIERKIELVQIADNNYSLLLDNVSYNAQFVSYSKEEKKIVLLVNGNEYDIVVKDKTDLLLQEMGITVTSAAKHNLFKAPMPGLIRSILVAEGQAIQKGDVLLILEAMKMENALKAPADLTVKNIKIQQGQAVEKNQLLIEFEN